MIQREVGRALDALDLRGRHLLVAVSGGLDSVSLLHSLLGLQDRFELELSVGHVDHGLRGEASEADARFVGELATGLDLPFALERVDPQALREGGSSRSRPTLQEAARRLRYAALRRMLQKLEADVIATAHTADDQAETVLLRLLRGCAPDGLAGIPVASPDGRIMRPLLAVARVDLEAYAAERGLRFREDASNASDAYARNRLRHHWLPQLARSFNPQLLRTLGRLAEAHRRDAEWIDALVAREFAQRVQSQEGRSVIERDHWIELPEPLAQRVVKRLIERAGGGRELTQRHIERVLAFLRRGKLATPGKVIELPGGLRLYAERETFVLEWPTRPVPVASPSEC
ncbi:MAG: tRNA lysidine(34) synthetase TilS [Myxococcota bacterium]|nr:tRNA lysidine(34) synthetase TilS [Myxococcota bacterium]